MANTAADRERIRQAREKAEKRQKNRVDHYKHYKSNRKRVAEYSRLRKKKAKQIASLKRQGRSADLAEAREQYKILSERQKKSLKSAKGHARQSYGSGAGRGNFKGVLRQQTPKVKTAAEVRAAESDKGKGEIVHYHSAPGRKTRASAPSVSSGKKPKSTTPKVNKLTKEQYKNLVKQRKSQADLNYGNYGTDDAKRKKSAGQKLYNSYDKKLKNSQYSYKSHVAAMKRRGKKATAASYAKFKRYNGI
jgi:hypothetical protein